MECTIHNINKDRNAMSCFAKFLLFRRPSFKKLSTCATLQHASWGTGQAGQNGTQRHVELWIILDSYDWRQHWNSDFGINKYLKQQRYILKTSLLLMIVHTHAYSAMCSVGLRKVIDQFWTFILPGFRLLVFCDLRIQIILKLKASHIESSGATGPSCWRLEQPGPHRLRSLTPTGQRYVWRPDACFCSQRSYPMAFRKKTHYSPRHKQKHTVESKQLIWYVDSDIKPIVQEKNMEVWASSWCLASHPAAPPVRHILDVFQDPWVVTSIGLAPTC